jgi:hypothetical protein
MESIRPIRALMRGLDALTVLNVIRDAADERYRLKHLHPANGVAAIP